MPMHHLGRCGHSPHAESVSTGSVAGFGAVGPSAANYGSAVAKLRFFFGTMGSGKSTQALQIHHNLRARGLTGVLATKLDRSGGQVSSRLGVAAEALEVTPGMDLGAVLGPDAEGSAARAVRRQAGGPVTYVVADEAQFYDETQVEQLAHLVDDHGVDVYAFGLLTSFQGRLFPATARWLELADERSELQVEARCWCGARATHNARLIDGRQIYEGDLLVVGDTPPSGPDAQTSMELDEHRVTYELLCRSHWVQGRTGPDPETHHLVRNERIDS